MDAMAALDRVSRAPTGFVPASKGTEDGKGKEKERPVVQTREIGPGLDEEEDEDPDAVD